MKKIMAVFDAVNYNVATSTYAIEFAKNSNAFLTAVFLRDIQFLDFTNVGTWNQPLVDFAVVKRSRKEELLDIKTNIKLFNQSCDEKGVHHKVHLDKGVPVSEVISESAYADVVIIDSQTSFSSVGERMPTSFVRDVLSEAHCPLLIVPQKYSTCEQVILCYDGTPSSVYAIKMFAYVFPEFTKKPAIVLSVKESSSNHFVHGNNLKELLRQHYSDLKYEIMHGDLEESFVSYLQLHGNNAIVVMGAYGRSAVSRFLQPSFSNKVIKDLYLPVFITHQ